jgi:hypothetical protein
MTDRPPQTRAALQAELAAGFRAARRPGLAAMVGSPDFNLWMKTESGWRPGVVSQPTNQGEVNGGLFQFWYGHDWAQPFFSKGNSPAGRFTMPPAEQAKAAATRFGLTAQDVRRYAAQIRAGTYKGWG